MSLHKVRELQVSVTLVLSLKGQHNSVVLKKLHYAQVLQIQELHDEIARVVIAKSYVTEGHFCG